MRVEYSVDVADIAGIAFVDQLHVKKRAARDECFGESGRTGVDGARRLWSQYEDQTLTTRFEHVVCDRMTNTTIVNAHQIVIAPPRIFYVVTIEENHRKLCFVERSSDTTIDNVPVRNRFEGGKEHTADSVADQALA